MRDLEAAFRHIRLENPDAADRWLADVTRQILTLEELPARCPVATGLPADAGEVRVLLVGTSLPYKVFFRIIEKRRGSGVVRVLHVRQALRRPLGGNQPR